jgi:hypothetical protein
MDDIITIDIRVTIRDEWDCATKSHVTLMEWTPMVSRKSHAIYARLNYQQFIWYTEASSKSTRTILISNTLICTV